MGGGDRTYEEREAAEAEETACCDGDDAGDFFPRGPAEDEESQGHERASGHQGHEAFFRLPCTAPVVELLARAAVEEGDVRKVRADGATEEAQRAEPDMDEVEFVDGGENEGEGLEPGEEEAGGEGGVGVEEKADGFGETECKRSDEGLVHEC